VRVNRGVWLLVCLFFAASLSVAQSPNGTISGIVLDPSGGVIVGADVLIINNATGVEYPGKANSEGYYVVANTPPGTYRIQVSNTGFKTIIKPDIVVHVEDALAINFTLPIGAASEIVTVEGGAPLVNTENASVGTVVDHKYVENMPLNGRSFQDLILLTPGVVTNSPQTASSIGHSGEFSVNGQRTESNYYTVDGVSADTGISPGDFGSGNSGSVTAATALGTTQALVSVDALQEFRVQSSSYSAEYGRSPGGQFAFVTRSGTNQWHGSAFEYLRNGDFDANNWFNDFFGQPEPPLRQNDFGGTLGGPIEIPKLYNGKDRTFFFFSYEGLRLVQPQASNVNQVPDTYLRACTAAPLRQVINAFPQPSSSTPTIPDCSEPDPNPNDGFANFISTWSNPASLDAYSVRFDHFFNDKLKLFFRFADAPSVANSRLLDTAPLAGTPSVEQSFKSTTRSYTLGATSVLSPRISNDFRLGYSSTSAHIVDTIDNFGGAVPVNLAQLQQVSRSPGGYSVSVNLFMGPFNPGAVTGISSGLQRQWNITDSLTIVSGGHQLKFGVDYRRLTPVQGFGFPNLTYDFFNAFSVPVNSPDFIFVENGPVAYPLYTNFGAFAQDHWKVNTRLNLSMGLRWEVNPPPGVTQGIKPYTVLGAGDLSTMTLAPQGTQLWKTTWFNFAPRLGVAYVINQAPGYETVVRGGGGVFFDTGQQNGSWGFGGVGLVNTASPTGAFPLPLSQLPPAVETPVAPYSSNLYAYPPHLQLPYTLQWNVAVEQALGSSQSMSATYVGSHAGRLLENSQVDVQPLNPNFGFVVFLKNGLTADYDALQGQYKRRLSHGLTALASWTWSHAIDYGSYNFAFPYKRGNSAFDVRQSFSSAFSYDLPNILKNRIAGAILHHWGLDDRFMARSGFPVTLDGPPLIDPSTGQEVHAGLNLIPGEPLYVTGPQYPGRRSINSAAFSAPPSGSAGDAPRNFVRGFGACQMDLAVRRDFPIHERLKLQFRAEAFNIFNHPNFGTIDPQFGSPTFGQAISTLNASLGGLSSLYQTGGPRSMQFSLRVAF
jgi:hypothetical protein